jgi:hypothetical protein
MMSNNSKSADANKAMGFLSAAGTALGSTLMWLLSVLIGAAIMAFVITISYYRRETEVFVDDDQTSTVMSDPASSVDASPAPVEVHVITTSTDGDPLAWLGTPAPADTDASAPVDAPVPAAAEVPPAPVEAPAPAPADTDASAPVDAPAPAPTLQDLMAAAAASRRTARS